MLTSSAVHVGGLFQQRVSLDNRSAQLGRLESYMSKAAGLYEPGGPDVLRLIEVDAPQAGPGQVRLRVKAAGVQPFDIAVVDGSIHGQRDRAVPQIPGNEFAGVVDQVGDAVTDVALGDEVLGYGTLNSYSEYLVVDPGQITAKPVNMPWEVAGGFSAGAQTADIGLREIGVNAGDVVLIHGAAGAVGSIAVQLCRLWGATVIGAARPAQHDYLRTLGAIPIAYGDGFVDAVRALSPRGVDACLDGVGGEALQSALELVPDRSRILTLVEHGRAAQLGIRTTPLTRSAARLAALADLYGQGKLTMHVLDVFPLARAADAHRRYMAGNIRGKIVITID